MKFLTTAAQGELCFTRIAALPKDIVTEPLALENGRFILGHSETGHHHVLERTANAEVVRVKNPPAGMNILYMILSAPNSVQHLRDHDTHEAIALEGSTTAPVYYEVRGTREHDHYAALARQSAD
jgi:hypothetical protein